MTLGERLLQYRTDAKMSQDVLAEKIGVTRQTISKWETDQSTPEFNKILPLCELYGISTDELIKGEKSEEEITEKLEEVQENSASYNQIRNKKRAKLLSISIFLYIIATFSVPYMEESLGADEGHVVMFFGVLCAIATALIIYFFVAYPKSKEEKLSAIEEEKRAYRSIEASITAIITLIFLTIYLIISFITMAWHVTWILWIVWMIVVVIKRLVFDLARRNKNEK